MPVIRSVPEIDGYEEAAKKLDLSAIDNQGDEYHRLCDEALSALVDLLVFMDACGIHDAGLLRHAAKDLTRDEAGKRSLIVDFKGNEYGSIRGQRQYQCEYDADRLGDPNALREAIALQSGLSLQCADRFISKNDSEYDPSIAVGCNQPGCRASRHIYFSTPTEMVAAENAATRELWYCHSHRKQAFEQHGVLPDVFLPILARISANPGGAATKSGANKSEREFLEDIGLIREETKMRGSMVTGRPLYITQAGSALLQRVTPGDYDG